MLSANLSAWKRYTGAFHLRGMQGLPLQRWSQIAVLTLVSSTWRLSAAACTASMVARPAADEDAPLLLQAWSTGVMAISKNSLASLRRVILQIIGALPTVM